MKRIILFFAVCLGLSVSQTTFADNTDTVRAASKRASTTVSPLQSTSRTTTTNTKRPSNTQNSAKNSRTATKPSQRVVSRTTTASQNVKPRETATVKTTTPTTTKRVSTVSRATSSRVAKQNEPKKTTSARSLISAKKISRASRVNEIDKDKVTTIKSLNYSKCKTVYQECMDEFCANKDSNLRRCACSSRIHEFDTIKKQLNNAEDKMLDFNQRLLTVSLDKEDALVINVATEGETAYATKDTTESEKILQKITNALNNSGDSKINNDLSAISLSLDMDTAWDNIDSTTGVTTSAKSGVDLYNAARPICVEMAREVCNDDELDIAQSSYKLSIDQDCDTVAKSYKTQYNSAMEKIHESSALLDMSRLNVYQQRNSDDTLACKKKILTQLYDTSVCGEDLYKCLDTTGQYIDPSTGKAFLSAELPELASLLQEPTSGERWSKIPRNENFVNFLNSKKKYLESATEQCQDIADVVWQEFIDDALAKIKLAQNTKLEEVRRSCTTLIADCKTEALQSLSDFDARALSTFGIDSDKAVNQMCSEIETACTSLIGNGIFAEDWKNGMAGIKTDISYQNIIDTCTTVGRDCIVRQCNGTSGNFALCQDVTDANRGAILNRTACWDEVLACVKKADNLALMNVTDLYKTTSFNSYWYKELSNNSGDSIYKDICDSDSTPTACYIAKQVWGTCKYKPDLYSITTNDNLNGNYVQSNKILTPETGDTLLSWFAKNTGTTDNVDSCNSNGCPIDYERDTATGTCRQLYTDTNNALTGDCGQPTRSNQIIHVTSNFTNYCAEGILDIYGNCCATGAKNNGICVPTTSYQAARLMNLKCTTTDNYFCPTTGNMKLYCVTTSTNAQPITYYTDSAEYECTDGFWVIVDENGNYFNADQSNANSGPRPVMYYIPKPETPCSGGDTPRDRCVYAHNGSGWAFYPTDYNLLLPNNLNSETSTCPSLKEQSLINQGEFKITYHNSTNQ